MQLFTLALSTMLAVIPNPSGNVSVAYAGSLVRVMEGPIASNLRAATGLRFAGEAKGSKALAHLIAAGLRTPDVFVSADPALLAELMHAPQGSLVSGYTIFGSARMVVAYSAVSPHRALFEEAAKNRRSILEVLADPAIRVGRTDPQLDPKGERTVRVIALLGQHFREEQTAQRVLRKADVFPEEDLAVRVESGELDCGFVYSTEVQGRGLLPIELPNGTNLSHQIVYAVAVLRHAPHPAAGKTFVRFMLAGPGRAILEQAGLSYFERPQVIGKP